MRDGEILEYARSNRAHMTAEESIVWSRLKRGQTGERFRRQYPVGRRILDFAVLELRLNVEIDGGSHDAESDAERDRQLTELGWIVVRFSAHAVRTQLDDVLSSIASTIQQLRAHR